MRLERIRAGDIVLCRIKGRSVYGEVLEVTSGRVNFHPLCPAAGWHHATAREIVSHWRRTGHRTADADREDQAPHPPLEQLSLPGVHT
jgi:hypothetical protein